MKHKTRILTLRTLSVLILVALLAALSPPALQNGGVALAQTVPTLTATPSGPTSIQVNWTEVADADSYRLIRWNSGPNWDDVGGVHTTTSYTDTGLTTGTKYFYQVTAVTDSLEGPWSGRQNAIPGSLDPPALSATASIGQIDLSWTDVSGAVSYNLIFWTSGQAGWDELGGGAIDGTSFNHPSLTNGATYFYQVRAVNVANTRSDWSNQLSTIVLQPGMSSAPTSVDAAFGDEEVTLTWAAPTSDGDSAITSYQYRYGEMGGTLSAWMNVGLALTATISSLTNGTTYEFEVQAVNAEGVGTPGSDTATPATVPGAPTLTATAGYGRIDLSWTAPADNGGAAISAYRIERQNAQGGWDLEARPRASATSHPDTGLMNAVEYTYRIFAINVAGDSEWTSATALTLANRPGVPAAPEAATTDPAATVSGPGNVTFNWEAPAFNGGAEILSYEYRYQVDR